MTKTVKVDSAMEIEVWELQRKVKEYIMNSECLDGGVLKEEQERKRETVDFVFT